MRTDARKAQAARSAKPSAPPPPGKSAIPTIRLKETDSSNAHARRLARAGKLARSPVAFVAERQTAGVGRFGRSWASPRGGLWLTLAWPIPEADLQAVLDGLGLRVGVACLRVVQKVVAQGARRPIVKLKWPNDILLAGHKVLGELTEIVHAPELAWAIVGVGINANFPRTRLPEELRDTATTLLDEVGHTVDLAALERDLLKELALALSARGLCRELLAEAGEHLHGLGRDIALSMPDGSRTAGTLMGLNEQGLAILQTDAGTLVAPLSSAIVL